MQIKTLKLSPMGNSKPRLNFDCQKKSVRKCMKCTNFAPVPPCYLSIYYLLLRVLRYELPYPYHSELSGEIIPEKSSTQLTMITISVW